MEALSGRGSAHGHDQPEDKTDGTMVDFRSGITDLGSKPLKDGTASIERTNCRSALTNSSQYSRETMTTIPYFQRQRILSCQQDHAEADPATAHSAKSQHIRQTVTLTATIDPKAHTDDMTVTFYDHTFTQVGNPTRLENGTASIQTAELPVGDHSLTAHVDGNAYYIAADSSPPVPYTVNPNKVTPVIGFNVIPQEPQNWVYPGDTVTMTATIDPNSLQGISVEGKSIDFQDGGNVLKSVPIHNNQAQWLTSTLPPKVYSDLKACIGADTDVNASCSVPFPYTIWNKTTLILDPPQPAGGSVLGEQVTLTAQPQALL